jgi:hypothetical protein
MGRFGEYDLLNIPKIDNFRDPETDIPALNDLTRDLKP